MKRENGRNDYIYELEKMPILFYATGSFRTKPMQVLVVRKPIFWLHLIKIGRNL